MKARKKDPGLEKTRVSSVLTAADELFHEEMFIATRAAEAAALIAGITPAKAAYSSSHIHAKRFTGSPPFHEAKRRTRGAVARVRPSRRGYFPPPGSYSHKRLCGNVGDEESYAQDAKKIKIILAERQA